MDGAFLAEPTVSEVISKKLAILATCKCGRAVEIKPTSVCIRSDTPVSDVGDHLTCKRCSRKGLVTRIVLPGTEYRPAR